MISLNEGVPFSKGVGTQTRLQQTFSNKPALRPAARFASLPLLGSLSGPTQDTFTTLIGNKQPLYFGSRDQSKLLREGMTAKEKELYRKIYSLLLGKGYKQGEETRTQAAQITAHLIKTEKNKKISARQNIDTIQARNAEDFQKLLQFLPKEFQDAFKQLSREEMDSLRDIDIDLGRTPRFSFMIPGTTKSRRKELLGRLVTQDDLRKIQTKAPDKAFGRDNRFGPEGTLHRISRRVHTDGKTVGYTFRIGRAHPKILDRLVPLLDSGKSILVLGKAGSGKSTLLREITRYLAAESRVEVIDTSMELGGSGIVSHPALGEARRMAVPPHRTQKEVMLEALQNHTPDVLIIDEIENKDEAFAARTIAGRGSQLIATVHGDLKSLVSTNTDLDDLIGSPKADPIADETMKKSGLESKRQKSLSKDPTFDIAIEVSAEDRESLVVFSNVKEAVTQLIAERPDSRKIGAKEVKLIANEEAKPPEEIAELLEKLSGDLSKFEADVIACADQRT